MKNNAEKSTRWVRFSLFGSAVSLAAVAGVYAQDETETAERIRVAATNMEDAVVVDCQLPGKLRRLGGTRRYLTPGRLTRTSAIVCRTRGGEYTLGDLASGTLSLKRWLEPAETGDPEAQYYVARIYANGMDDVPVNYSEAARWYGRAAAQGFAEAKQELGYLYEFGLGVDKDPLRALNLQRDASGLGEDLDFAHKIADAQARADRLARQLVLANGALQDSQQSLQSTQDDLIVARERLRFQENEILALVASLNIERNRSSSDSSAKVDMLERNIASLQSSLEESQASILELEQDRDEARDDLARQMAGGQATQQQLREILNRTKDSEQEVESLSVLLTEAQQRLLQSDEELRNLRTAYSEQSAVLTAERERLLEARAKTDTEAAAYLAAKAAEVLTSTARVASLELKLRQLRAQLVAASADDSGEEALRRELDALQSRYDADVAQLGAEREQLERDYAASSDELQAQFAETKQELAQKDRELASRKLQIDVLTAESTNLRSRVNELEDEYTAQAKLSGDRSAQLQAELNSARQEVTILRQSLASQRAEKAAIETKLAKDRLELQERLAAETAASAQELQLLRADVSEAEGRIQAQNLRIAALQGQIDERDDALAQLKADLGATDPYSPEMQNAIAVLEMARSNDEPNLGRFHALLIANENYTLMDSLNTPIRDVSEIESLLQSRYGFTVDVLTNATRHDIFTRLDELSHRLTPEDNLLIYYAGRGSTPEGGPPDLAYWQGVDAHPKQSNTWVLAEHVSEKIKQIVAKRILLVTDSCFSRRRMHANSTAVGVGVGLDPEKFRILSQFQSRFVLTSGANVPVQDHAGDRTHSLFAKVFMEVLRQNNNVLSGEMLSFEMDNRVRERLDNPERATPSYNVLHGVGHKVGDFFFVPTLEPTLYADAAGGNDDSA